MTSDPTAAELERSALITIDVQVDTLDGEPLEVPGTSAVLPHLTRLCTAFRDAGLPIVHVIRLYLADGSNAELCRRTRVAGPLPVLWPGTAGRRLAAGIARDDAPELDDDLLLSGALQPLGPNEIAIFKPRWGAFYRTPLEEHLRRESITTTVFAGCNYPNCPRTSVYEASERDFKIVLVKDAVSGLYDRGEAEMRSIGVAVASTCDVVGQLDHRSPAPDLTRETQ